MAERQRFELWKVLPPCRFSRPVLSTAQPSLRFENAIYYLNILILEARNHQILKNGKNAQIFGDYFYTDMCSVSVSKFES